MFPAAFLDINMEASKEFLLRFAVNIVSLVILVRLLYYEYRREGIPEYLFSFFLLGIVVFMICTVLHMVNIEIGMALGLFALFGIIRYRTESIPVREMTYLFLAIGIGMINSLVAFENFVNGLILYNTLVITPVWILEAFLCKTRHGRKEMVYDNLEDVYKGEEHVKEALTERTGMNISKVKIGKIDMVRMQANLIVFFKDKV